MDRVEYLVALGVLLAVAAGTDVARRRVPNAIPVVLLLGGFASRAATGGWRAAALSAAVALAVGAVLIVPWSMRIIGGADVKLVAATAAWMGRERVGAFLLATAIAGGVLAIPHLRGLRATSAELLVAAGPTGAVQGDRPARERRVPLAVAIALGAAAAIAVGSP